ncbi:hypothetical protein BDZ45DRAFT_457277 [Acephala macrosclerotiorum]|nr:hypothetical protein BDZ45DRAFT_457277 [Acephala macrosclerotiorum]
MHFFQNLTKRLNKLKGSKAREAKNQAVVANEHELARPPAVQTEDIGSKDVQHNSLDPHDVQERASSAIDLPLSQDSQEKAPEIENYGMFCFTTRQPTVRQTIDLVAIHGLGGHYNGTWTDANTNQNWLRDFLPEQIPQVRVMSWGYNSAVFGTPSVGNITSFAQALLNDLKGYRPKELEKRPLIFVCHSLGGVVFKRALALSHERGKLYQTILDAIKGVAFLGTPHAGSELATMLSLLAKISNVASFGHTNNKLVSALKSQGDELLSISESFVERGEKLDKIYSFFEQEKIYGTIASARIGLPNEELVPMDCNHSSICKFSSPENKQYERVLFKLQELVDTLDESSQCKFGQFS